MKTTFIKSLVPFVMAMLVSGIAFGETLQVNINISDNCSGQPPQYYYAVIKVVAGSTTYCENIVVTNLSYGQNACVSFNCPDIDLDSKDPIYEIIVEVHRQVNPPSACYGRASTGLLHAEDLQNCNATVNVTLN